MMTIDQLIATAREQKASDVHLSAGVAPVTFRRNGALQEVDMGVSARQVEVMLLDLLDEKKIAQFQGGADVDFALQTADGNRQRVNMYRCSDGVNATIRLLNNTIPTLAELGLPAVLSDMAKRPRGLILVTGPTGSGKSTTLAAMLEQVNRTRPEHIITIEDPIEYMYEPKKCLIHQREVGRDVTSFAAALRSALREDPDVILVGEMRDYETISAALTAAETGHLVLSTLHTNGAARTMDRIIDACPAGAQNQVRTQLSGVLGGVVTQCLIPKLDGSGRVPATEVLIGTDAVLNLIRENKCHQMETSMQSGAAYGMHTLNSDLYRLVQNGQIARDQAYRYTNNQNDLEQYLGSNLVSNRRG